MMNIILAGVLLCCLAAAVPLVVHYLTPSWRHLRNRKTAERIYSRINSIRNDSPEWLCHYLRKIDPYVFEELILHTFRMKGYRIRHNRTYSGDGGIDGRITKDGQRFLIQAKRYSGYVDIRQVEEFLALCRRRHRKGYFVTTGKVGRCPLEMTQKDGSVIIIHGELLYDLFIEDNGRKDQTAH